MQTNTCLQIVFICVMISMQLNMTHKDKHNYCQQMLKKIVRLVKSQTSCLLIRKKIKSKKIVKNSIEYLLLQCVSYNTKNIL